MSSATATEILIPAPLPHQVPIVLSTARFKVVRAGRRGGKTVLAEHCAVVGHGPTSFNIPLFKGIAHDLDVVWVARDYTQAGIMWHEFIRPRFKNKPGVRVNEAERTVTLDGGGTLFVVSAENIASVRGVGKRLGGVVIEEAAWLALGDALRNVVMPALMDNEGWLLLISTTNAGSDGGKDEYGQPQSPSYFNQICTEIRAGLRSSEWEEFHFDARDNPRITQRAFDSLVAEYSPDSPSLKQEVYADLLASGVGLALPELHADTHLVTRFPVPPHWTEFGAFDWGFNHPWVFGHYAADEDGNVVKVETLWGREDLPHEIAEKILLACPNAKVKPGFWIHAGHDIWDKKGESVGFKGPTIYEQMTEKGLRLVKANTSRVLGLDNVRRYAHVHEKTRRPRFTLMNTEGNKRCLAQLQSMQLDPKDLEDALKVDADPAGRGGDDGYDETRYGLMSRPMTAPKGQSTRHPTHEEVVELDNRHPGLDVKAKSVKPDRPQTAIPQGFKLPNAYKVPTNYRVKR